MGARLSISVVMPSFNAAHYMERSLPPLIALREQGEIDEVYVVDDCSTKDSNIETATRLGARVLKLRRNMGPGAARNFACRNIATDIVWFVDADVVAHATGPARIREAFADQGVVAVFGSYDDKPPGRNFASQYKNLVHRYYHQRGRDNASTFWAGCGAVRRVAFLAVGGFDRSRYEKPMIEDIELGHRLIDAGGRIRLVHDLLGTHLKYWNLPEVIRTDIFQRALPWARLMLATGRQDNDLNVSPAEKVRAAIAGLWIASLGLSPLALVWPQMLAVLALTTMLVAFANAPLARFFAAARGSGFAIAGVLFHQVYYVYSAATYTFCVMERMLAPKQSAQPQTVRLQMGAEDGVEIESTKSANH